MGTSRRELLVAVAATGGIAGCLGTGGDDGDGDDGDGDGNQAAETDSPTDSPTAAVTDSPTEASTDAPTETGTNGGSVATVAVSDHSDLGEILVDGEGLTLYMFDSDTEGAGESTCYDGCAEAWPPLSTSGEPTAGDGVTASLDTFEREGGERQVTAAGWPLYYYASDEAPGDAKGQGVNDVWWVLRPDGTPVRASGTETPTPTDDASGDGGDGDDDYY